MRRVSIYRTSHGDWVALYIDGELVEENHSLTPEQVMRALDVDFEKYEVDGDRMENEGEWTFYPDENQNPIWFKDNRQR